MPWVECEQCGHVWQTKAKRPQCSLCRGTRTKVVPKPQVLSMSDDSPLSSVDKPQSIGFKGDDITLSSESAHDDSGADRAGSIDVDNDDSGDDIKITTDDSSPQNQERVADDSAVITDQHKNQRKTGKPIDGGQSAQNQQISTIGGVLVALGVILLLGAAGYWLMSRRKHHKAPPRQLTPW